MYTQDETWVGKQVHLCSILALCTKNTCFGQMKYCVFFVFVGSYNEL
jgi:hypothetical protein